MSDHIDVSTLKGITQDSRQVKPGYLFAALPGTKTSGVDYIKDAIEAGASIILIPEGTDEQGNVRMVACQNTHQMFAYLAADFYKDQPETIVAVTGTNGKTSVAEFTRQLWEAAGYKSASLGTLGLRAHDQSQSGSMTTPDPVTLHQDLAEMSQNGITHLAMEASSHGLDQYRLDGVKIKAAAFTNLSRDHMDYHPDMDHYFMAKARLFSELLPDDGVTILNADNEYFEKLASMAPGKTIAYGYAGQDLKILERTPTPSGQDLKLEILGETIETHLPLVGEFQIMNILCALGLVIAQDPNKKPDFIKALSSLSGVPGRLQPIPGHPKGAGIYIDYAHTPDALETVLKALRPHTENKLVCLFGCGGDRDKGKRPMMGKIASDLADHVIVTDDNPRSEDPAAIRKDILEAAPQADEIDGRALAIQTAIQNLEAGDVLVIAGKGHEQGQIFADHTDPFDDAEEAQKALDDLKRGEKIQ